MDIAKMRELFKATASTDSEGIAAYKAFCAAVTIPILQKVESTSIMRQLFNVEELGPGAQAIYPVDDDFEIPVWVLPGLGAVAHNFIEYPGHDVVVPTFNIDASAEWKVQYALDGRLDIVDKAISRVAKDLANAEERCGWEIVVAAATTAYVPEAGSLLRARPAPIYQVPSTSTGAGYLSKELINRMIVGMKRVDRVLTDLYISPEDAADIREWTDTDIDPVTRREIFQASGMGKIWNITLHETNHLGAQGFYNINSATSGYGIFLLSGGSYNSYTPTHANVVDADGQVTTLGETQIYGFDLSDKGSLVMPIKKAYEAIDDPTLLRQQKQGFFGWESVGFACLDSRMLSMGVIDRSI